jgi:hypothetical protein
MAQYKLDCLIGRNKTGTLALLLCHLQSTPVSSGERRLMQWVRCMIYSHWDYYRQFIGKVGMSVLTKGLAMDFVRQGRKHMAITSIWPASVSSPIISS